MNRTRQGCLGIAITTSLIATSMACTKSSSSAPGAPASGSGNTASMEFTGVRPIAGKPGDQMNLSGTNLRDTPSALMDFGSVTAPVTVTSAETATFVMPDGLGLGLKEATARVGDTAAGKFALVANSAANTLPIIIAESPQVCNDVTYINAAGDQETGTRDCSGGGSISPTPTPTPTPEPTPTPDAYDIRKGATVAGVAGKLIAGCQNRSNKSIFDMADKSRFVFARVKTIEAGRIFHLDGIVGEKSLLVADNTAINPVGYNHPLKSGGTVMAPYFLTSLKVKEPLDGGGVDDSAVYVTDNAADQIAIKLNPTGPTLTLSGADCNNGVGPDCFDIVVVNLIPDPWDTIDDLNGDNPAGFRAFTPPDSSPYEPFQANICGYIDGGHVPAGATATWKDNTLNDAGEADTCVSNAGNCAIKDLLTGLTWIKGDGAVKNWYEAVLYCNSMTVSAKSWRLPTQKELMTAYANTIRNTVGSGTVQEYNLPWWSSTTDSTDPLYGWTVNLATGATVSKLKTLKVSSPPSAKAVCVRSDE